MKFSLRLAPDSEKRTALLAASFLFSIMTSFILLKSARDAFFLSSFSSRKLPYVMVANTVVSALAGLSFLRIYRYFSLPRVIRVSFSIFIAGTLLFWRAIGPHSPDISWLFYLWVGIFGTIAPVQAWALISLQFSSRQARRLMGLVGGGAIFGAVAGGLIARILAKNHFTPLLLPSAALFVFLAVLICLCLSPRNPAEEIPATTSVNIPRNYRRFALLLFLIVAIGTVVSAFIDFEFKSVVQREIRGTGGLAAFFGSFYAYLGAATLLFQLTATPLLMRRLGIAATLALLPLALFVGNALVVVVGLFVATIVMRSGEELFRYSVDRSSLEVLYVALPEQAKVRLKSLIDTVGVRLPEGLACVLLIALFSVGHSALHFLFLVNGVLIFLWIVCCIFLAHYEYPRLLKEEIQRKEINLESVKSELFTQDFYRLLPQLFQNGENQSVLEMLDLLEASGKRWIGPYLTEALRRNDHEIQRKVLRILFYQDANLSSDVRRLLNENDSALRAEVVHYLCWRTNVSPSELTIWQNDPDLFVRAASASVHLKKRSQQAIGFRLLEALRDQALEKGDENARCEICHVLEFAQSDNESAALFESLLADPSLEVRRAALRSVRRARPQSAIPILLRMMSIPAVAADVRTALTAYGAVLVPYITKILEDPAERVLRKKTALQVAADIGASNALPVILTAARHPNQAIRFAAIKALNRLKKQTPSLSPPQESVLRIVNNEVDELEEELQRIENFSPRPDGLLMNVLRQRYGWAVERIFRLIALSEDQSRIYYTYLAWNSGDSRLRDAALDLLERQLDPLMKQKLFPLLEQFPEGQVKTNPELRKQAAFSWMDQREPLLTAAIIADLTDDELVEWGPQIESIIQEYNHALITEILSGRRMKMENGGTQPAALTTIEKMEHLSKVDIFSNLGSHELLLLADQAVEVRFAQGDRIFAEGEIPREAYSVLEGAVLLDRSGKPLTTVKAGESFGTLELLSNQTRLFSASAETTAQCLKIDREVLWEILEDYPAVSRSILEYLVQQIRILTDRFAESVTV